MLVFILGKCVRTAAKTMIVDRKKPAAGTSSAIFGRQERCEILRPQPRSQGLSSLPPLSLRNIGAAEGLKP